MSVSTNYYNKINTQDPFASTSKTTSCQGVGAVAAKTLVGAGSVGTWASSVALSIQSAGAKILDACSCLFGSKSDGKPSDFTLALNPSVPPMEELMVLDSTPSIQITPKTSTSPLPIENSAWISDWMVNLDNSQYIDAVTTGVNTINIFVGQLDIVNGQAVLDGYVNDPSLPGGRGAFPNQAALTDFISQCKAKGVKVKLSIGGSTSTTFGNSWNKLTAANLDSYAQALVTFCNSTGAQGLDFDNEMTDTGIAALVGQLMAKVKTLNSDLDISCCVFAWINSNGPGFASVQAMLKNAVVSGNSAIDRIYVMSYWDGSIQENQTYLLQWKDWLQKNYNMSPSQISCGVDPTDPNESPSSGNLTPWIQFAAQNGFSTAIFDNQGVLDYIQNNWGQVVQDIYTGKDETPSEDAGRDNSYPTEDAGLEARG